MSDETDLFGRKKPSRPLEGTGDQLNPKRQKSSRARSYSYDMTHRERGDFYIINNKQFHPSTRQGERDGTDVDGSNLYGRFASLGFNVIQYNNLTCAQMLKVLVEAAKKDHSNADCFGCAILSHGDEGVVYGVDGQILIDQLVEPFKGDRCKSLLGKPKIFIIQACRGDQIDSGCLVEADGITKKDKKVYRVPTEADFLYAYATVAGFFSFRNKTNGSWFIQTLCKVLEECGQEEDIMSILTRVNYEVAYNYESNVPFDKDLDKKKQIPSILSMLTKELVFSPKKDFPVTRCR